MFLTLAIISPFTRKHVHTMIGQARAGTSFLPLSLSLPREEGKLRVATAQLHARPISQSQTLLITKAAAAATTRMGKDSSRSSRLRRPRRPTHY